MELWYIETKMPGYNFWFMSGQCNTGTCFQYEKLKMKETRMRWNYERTGWWKVWPVREKDRGCG